MYNITLKNIMRQLHPIKGFVYDAVGWDEKEKGSILAEVRAREDVRAVRRKGQDMIDLQSGVGGLYRYGV